MVPGWRHSRCTASPRATLSGSPSKAEKLASAHSLVNPNMAVVVDAVVVFPLSSAKPSLPML